MAGSVRYATATNSAATVTIPAPSDNTCAEITSIMSSYQGGTPSGGKITIESPSGTTIGSWDITAEGQAPVPFPGVPLPGAEGQSIVVTLAAAGSGVVGKLTVVTRD